MVAGEAELKVAHGFTAVKMNGSGPLRSAGPGISRAEAGAVARLTAPGLPIDVDAAAVERAAETGPHWHNPVWRRDDGSLAER